MSSIDFITVNWKTPDYIKLTVDSIRKFVTIPHHVYVVNNGDMSDIDYLKNIFEDNHNVHILEGIKQLPNSSIPGLKKDIEDPWIHTKHDKRKVHLASYALAEGLKIGLKKGSSDYVSFIQSDVVFLDEWVDDVLPMLEENEFVSYSWRHDIDQANLPQWSVMKRSIFDSDFLYEPGDLYPNIHYKDTLGLLSLWVRKKEKKYFICKNSWNDRSLKSQHILDVPHGEQGWINGKPFVYHYGRGTTRDKNLKQIWIDSVSNYLK
tara:strand:+ start:10160 stop:10948 length:789 start_codon:yes stop_codon:yes gene_type:complete